MKILVTGGAGYIGSHTVVELLNANHEVVIVDNLSNSSKIVLDKIEAITNKIPEFFEGDILDKGWLRKIFTEHKIEAVIHFAAFKAVGESVEKPLMYYSNNITGTLSLCEVMVEFGVKDIVFSSSATVYGDPEVVPITEDSPLSGTNPYGRTKLMMEDILRDLHASDKDWNIALLRYFNPVGAHESGTIGEDPNGIPNNLMPFITQVAVGKREKLCVFGGDYDTKDGTAVRDYIHVVDLAIGHLKALEKIEKKPGLVTYNLGTGMGNSVLEVIEAFETATNAKINREIVARRPGDAKACYADPSFAEQELGWKAERDIKQMCADSWNWQSKNPNGFEK